MTPLKNNIIITRISGDLTTPSGLILKSSQDVDRASVVSIGPDVDEVAVGDMVLVNWNKATKIKDDDYVISINDVVFIYNYTV